VNVQQLDRKVEREHKPKLVDAAEPAALVELKRECAREACVEAIARSELGGARQREAEGREARARLGIDQLGRGREDGKLGSVRVRKVVDELPMRL